MLFTKTKISKVLFCLLICSTSGSLLLPTGCNAANEPVLHPEPDPIPFEQRNAPYSVVIFRPPADHEQCRQLLETIKEMGVTRPFASVLWWQMETMGGDYWKEMGYAPGELGATTRNGFENYVNISLELGMTPCIRVGTFRSSGGLYHPMEKTRNEENYANWLRQFARKYRGKIEHYIIGDEMNKSFPQWNYHGTPEEYIKIFAPLAKAIHEGDPAAHVTPASTSSSPATDWLMGLIDLGLPDHADGVACHFAYRPIENLVEIEDVMKKVRAVWPEAKFYGNGFGYVDRTSIHDPFQAGVVAQCAFTLWDVGWDSFPYYTYKMSKTADTHQDFGLMRLGAKTSPAVYADAWKAYQTIAQTFYDRDRLKRPAFDIKLRQATVLTEIDGVKIRLAPPKPVFKAFNRIDRQLLLYLAYRKFSEPREGKWDIILDSKEWAGPQQVPLLDYKGRIDLPHHIEDGKLVIENVTAGLQPTIITLRHVK